MSDPDPFPTAAGSTGTIAGLLRLVRARASDRVLIAGAGGFDSLVELCRRGFLDVRYEAVKGPCDGESADLVWVPHGESLREPSCTIARLGRQLRAGGLLVMRLGTASASRRGKALRDALAGAGFVVLEQQSDGGGCLLAACRLAAERLAHAA